MSQSAGVVRPTHSLSARLKALVSSLDWLFVLVLAALPRLTSLGKFLIIDEPGRWDWAERFYLALAQGNPAGTAIHGYPGILPNWLTSGWIGLNVLWRSLHDGRWLDQAGLNDMLRDWGRVPEHLVDQRLGVVVANTLLVLLAYLLMRRLFDRRLALVAATLIALDPFYLTDARVNRAEGITAGVVFACLLLFLLHLRERRWSWLILSGAAAGLGCLSKIQTLVILPIVGLIALGFWASQPGRLSLLRRSQPWLVRMAVWCLVVAVTFCVAWPVMWVQPLQTLAMVRDYAGIQSGEEGVNLFFLGRVVHNDDPGPLFYPVAFLLRTTPLALLGSGAAMYAAWRRRTGRKTANVWWAIALFCLSYPLIMTVGSHKQDRYLLTIFPMVDLLAAGGLLWLWQRLLPLPGWDGWRRDGCGLALLVVAQAAFILPYHPYYYPYFNPLLGGSLTAPHMIRIGWGEGLDQVADFLNTLPAPRRLNVATRFPRHLVGFEGDFLALDAEGEWTRADYIVFYIQQLQRKQDPGPGEIAWLQTYPMVHEVRLAGIQYAQVYHNPLTVPADPQLSQVPGDMQLFGYVWPPEETSEAQETVPLRLVWRNDGNDLSGGLSVRMAAGETASEWVSCRSTVVGDAGAGGPGDVVESLCPVGATPHLPAGIYDLQVGWNPATGMATQLVFPEGQGSLSVRDSGRVTHLSFEEALDAVAEEDIPNDATSTSVTYDERLRLIGHRGSSQPVVAGQPLELTLYWQALEPMEQDYTTFVQAFDPAGQRVAAANHKQPTAEWHVGAVQTDTYELPLPADLAAPVALRVDAGWQDDAMQLLRPADEEGRPLPWTVTSLKVIPARWPELTDTHPVSALFSSDGAAINLTGYVLAPDTPTAGETLDLTLFWTAEGRPARDYTVFVQVLDGSSRVVAQADGPPRGGAYPTSWWDGGETIADSRTIVLPADMPSGGYDLVLGLYRLEDGVRVSVSAQDTMGSDALVLRQLEITEP